MNLFRAAWMLSVLLFSAASGEGADLSKIDRTIKKEPLYEGKPRYCLLVFGPEARKKVWLVLDDKHLYVDRNGHGDLTEPNESVALPAPEAVPIPPDLSEPGVTRYRTVQAGDIPDGTRKHIGLVLTQSWCNPKFRPQDRREERMKRMWLSAEDGVVFGISLSVALSAPKAQALFVATGDTNGFLTFAGRPQEASIVHFDGPLQMGLVPWQELVRGEQPSQLHCQVGTPGLGKGTFVSLGYATAPSLIPAEVHPVADIEFPGTSRLRNRVVLEHRC